MPYFEKILEVTDNPENIKWEISFHSETNLNKIDGFAETLNSNPRHIEKFRLDERVLSLTKLEDCIQNANV